MKSVDLPIPVDRFIIKQLDSRIYTSTSFIIVDSKLYRVS